MSKYIKLEDAINLFGRSGEYHADAIVDMLFFLPTIEVSEEALKGCDKVDKRFSEDAISREYMLRALNGYGKDWQEDCEIAEIIRNAPSVIPKPKEGEWIPCSERLPSNFSEDETVLATTDVDGDGVIPMFAFDVKSFYLKGYVSAWMPLPEPWKGADDE